MNNDLIRDQIILLNASSQGPSTLSVSLRAHDVNVMSLLLT